MTSLHDIVAQIQALGATPIPVQGKRPYQRGWNEPDYEPTWTGAEGVGIALGRGPLNLVAIDFDHKDPDKAWEAVENVLNLYPDAPVKWAPKGKGATILVRTAVPFETRQIKPVDLLGCTSKGFSTQTVIWGPHPNGGRYEYLPSIPDWCFPTVEPEWLLSLLPEPERPRTALATARATVRPRTEEIEYALGMISPEEYEDWLRVGMALHDNDPSPAGLALWIEWSKGSEKYEEGVCEDKWETFEKGGEGRVTIGSVLYVAKEGDLRSAYFGHHRDPYTEEEWDTFGKALGLRSGNELTRNVLLNRDGDRYFVLCCNGWKGPFRSDAIETRMRQLAAAAPPDTVRLYSEEGKALPIKALAQRHCTIQITEVHYSTYETHPYIDGSTLVIAAPPTLDLTPQHDPDVAEWLESLCSPGHLEYLLDWLATCYDLDRPAPMLYLQGAASRGKTLLATALGEYFGCPPTSGKGAFQDKNHELTRNPIIHIDEKLPTDYKGNELIDDLKTLVSDTKHRVERKFHDSEWLIGAVRVIFTSNPNAFTSRKAVTFEQDVDALAERLVHIIVKDGPALDPDTATKWLEHRTIIRHVLHLRATRTVQSGRFICRSNGKDIAQELSITSPWVMSVLQKVMRTIEQGKVTPAIVVKDGEIFVNGRMLLDKSSHLTDPKFPDERALAVGVWPRLSDGQKTFRRAGKVIKYRRVSARLVLTWIKLMDRDPDHHKQALLEYEMLSASETKDHASN